VARAQLRNDEAIQRHAKYFRELCLRVKMLLDAADADGQFDTEMTLQASVLFFKVIKASVILESVFGSINTAWF
jgi:hypothetical protein